MHGSGAANFIIWSNLYSDQNTDYLFDAWTITAVNFRYVGDNAHAISHPADTWANGPVTHTPGHNILVDTYGITSQDLVEYFDDEARRQDPGFNSGSFAGNWDSTLSLAAGQVQVFNGQIMHPDAATLFSTTDAPNTDWSGYKPDLNGLNPDYTPLSGQSDVNYYRTFRDSTVNGGPLTGISRSSGNIVFTGHFLSGSAAQDLANGDIEIYMYKVSGIGNTGAPPANTTPLLMHGPFYNFATFDDGVTDGYCRQATSAGNVVDFTFGGYNAEDGVYIHVRIMNSGIRIGGMQVTFI
jgi:hypothetical protein